MSDKLLAIFIILRFLIIRKRLRGNEGDCYPIPCKMCSNDVMIQAPKTDQSCEKFLNSIRAIKIVTCPCCKYSWQHYIPKEPMLL